MHEEEKEEEEQTGCWEKVDLYDHAEERYNSIDKFSKKINGLANHIRCPLPVYFLQLTWRYIESYLFCHSAALMRK